MAMRRPGCDASADYYYFCLYYYKIITNKSALAAEKKLLVFSMSLPNIVHMER